MRNAGENKTTGTTTDSYVMEIALAGQSKRVTIAIANTGTKDMLVKVTNKHNTGGSIEITEVEDILVTAGSVIRYIETKLASQILVYLKSNLAGNPTTFNLEYVQGSI